MKLDLHVNMMPWFYMVLKLIVWMAIPGIIIALITNQLPGPIFRLLLVTAILGGAYGFFKYGL